MLRDSSALGTLGVDVRLNVPLFVCFVPESIVHFCGLACHGPDDFSALQGEDLG